MTVPYRTFLYNDESVRSWRLGMKWEVGGRLALGRCEYLYFSLSFSSLVLMR